MIKNFDHFDTTIQIDECVPSCPYCDQPLSIGGPIKDGMHSECNDRFGEELQAAFPDPDDILIEPADEILPIGEAELQLEIDRLLARN